MRDLTAKNRQDYKARDYEGHYGVKKGATYENSLNKRLWEQLDEDLG